MENNDFNSAINLLIDDYVANASQLTNGTGGGQIVEGSYTVYKNPTVPWGGGFEDIAA